MAWCSVADVKAKARLGAADVVDDTRIAQAITAAATLIARHLDLYPSDPPFSADEQEILRAANVHLALELVLRPPFGQLNYGDIATTAPGDVMAGVASMLAPLRRRWGIG